MPPRPLRLTRQGVSDAPNGVRIGQRVRDLDRKDLGRVTRVYPWGFAVRKGLPLLFRQDFVVRHDEVRGERDGALVVARSDADLLELAAGGMPRAWQVPAPPGFPYAATPAEARQLFQELAAPRPAPLPEPPPFSAFAADAGSEPPLDAEEERAYAGSRGQSLPAQPGHP